VFTNAALRKRCKRINANGFSGCNSPSRAPAVNGDAADEPFHPVLLSLSGRGALSRVIGNGGTIAACAGMPSLNALLHASRK